VGMGIDIQKEIDSYSFCNGEPVAYPPVLIANTFFAGTKCLAVEEEWCAKRCIFANLPGAFVDNKLNLKWFKDEARKVTVSANNEAAREQIIKELDNCGKQGDDMPEPKSASVNNCPEWKKFNLCAHNNFVKICKGNGKLRTE
ncbi:hypothetical protein Fcan01_00235, partial [Folsomia candida]